MMAFVTHQGIAAPLVRANIDTDTIIPSREMRHVSKQGLGEGLFAGWRYQDENPDTRRPRPDFILNKPEYANASILLGGDNFGCGSSREHAVWALVEYGFRAIIAPSFGSIFYGNAVGNGLLPIRLPGASIQALSEYVSAGPQTNLLHIDLQQTRVSAADGKIFRFSIEPLYQKMLLQGQDAIDMTLQQQEAIDSFQAADRQRRGWAYL